MAKYCNMQTIEMPDRKWPSRKITKAPRWCSVDLRDGNQALVSPMNVEQKKEFFRMLVEIGFREIEIGFPSASKTEFDFTRGLIKESLIPDNVTVQVLTQAREHLIYKTFEALSGVRKVIIHLYNSTSAPQREIVFGKTQAEIIELAVRATELIRSLSKQSGIEVALQYSPESFSQTELSFAREICDAVVDTWAPQDSEKVIINLPSTVEVAMPNVYADQIEWMSTNLKNKNNVIFSVHTHNDRGCAVAAAELAILAGAQRVEGTLFGNGERTGNADLVTIALNLYTQGIDPEMDIFNIDGISEVYSRCTSMTIHPRHPYAGELVYTAFSGSHQDAISKGIDHFNTNGGNWCVPYLPIDPKDVGRSYEAVIRINSQSGKGGAARVLRDNFGFVIPREMQAEFGSMIQNLADRHERELRNNEIGECFYKNFINLDSAPVEMKELRFENEGKGVTKISCVICKENGQIVIEGRGNGPVDAFVQAFSSRLFPIKVMSFCEHSLCEGSDARAVAYIQIEWGEGERFFGAGIDNDIACASVKAVICAVNRFFNSRVIEKSLLITD
jgi:2-isopropylmalate synthase